MKKIPIVMPQMGQSVAEGVIIAWRKQVGDEVQADEILMEIETDKTSVEVESSVSGRLASCLKQAGEIAAAGEIIGMIETEDVDAGASPPSQKDIPHAGADDEAVIVSASSVDLKSGKNILPEINRDYYSPAVLRLAMSNHITLKELESSIQGTGRGGRVTRNDVLNYLSRRPAKSYQTLVEDVSQWEDAKLGKIVPMTTIRKTIADHMVQSIHTSAHVTMVHAVDMTHIVSLRNQLKEEFEKKHHAKLTYTAVMIFVTAQVLKDFPMINACVKGTTIIQRNEINIGCAVALSDESLVVPVIHHTDQKSLLTIACDLHKLVQSARRKELTRDHIEGGTFTISNFGGFGSLIGTPIINQPQVAILGMGAVYKAPVVVEDHVCIRDQMYLSFSFDHRVIDGALGGRFLNAIQHEAEALTAEAVG